MSANRTISGMPANAGIQWLQELGDPRFRGDDGKLVFFDTLQRGEGIPWADGFPPAG